jgi:hypothetical protein
MKGILRWNSSLKEFLVNYTDPFGNSKSYPLNWRTRSFPPGSENFLHGQDVMFEFAEDDGMQTAELIIDPFEQIESNRDDDIEKELSDKISKIIDSPAYGYITKAKVKDIMELIKSPRYKNI